jgi:hypothetical protein
MGNSTNSFKKIFSYPLLLFKKLGKDSFVNGLIWGAIFSLVVNVVTIQLQESLQKQRVFEAIENEIFTNLLTASAVMDENDTIIENEYNPDFYKLPAIYNDEVWRSSEALKYIVQLDSDLQAELYAYYNPYILQINQIAEKDTVLAEETLRDCYFSFDNLLASEQRECNEKYYEYLDAQSGAAYDVYEWSDELLNIFHPTQDRLNNPFLRLVMGKKAVGGLLAE